MEAKTIRPDCPLDGQPGLGAIWYVNQEGVGIEGQQRVVAHQGGQFGHTQRPQLLNCRVECGLRRFVSLEQFQDIVDHNLFFGGQLGQGFLVPKRIDKLVAYALLSGPGRMGLPNLLAVHRPPGQDHPRVLGLPG